MLAWLKCTYGRKNKKEKIWRLPELFHIGLEKADA